MDIKELRINSWLDSPVDNDYSDPLYIENDNDNHTFCNNFSDDILKLTIDGGFTIKNENQLRDDIIELIYKYSHEHK